MEEKKNKFKLLIKEFHEMSLPRVIERDLKLPQKTEKIITIYGPRRSGKSFYFFYLIKKLKKKFPLRRILYINFEDDRILPLELKDLNLMLEAYFELYPENKDKRIYLFFDEIQNIKGWEIFVRRIYDKEKTKIFITGSSSKLLIREIASALRGRTLSFNLLPLSFAEFLRFKNIKITPHLPFSKERFKIKKLLEEYIVFGGFPEVVLEEERSKFQILKNYYEMTIYRDLLERYSLKNLTLLKNLLKYLITNISNPFSINSYYKTFKKDFVFSRQTLLQYLSFLEDIETISFVPIFSYSLKSQQINPKKVYCLDNGLRNAVAFRFSQDLGRLSENMVFQELKRRGGDIYFWKKKGEVDFVVKKDGDLYLFNAFFGEELKEREQKSILEFKEYFKEKIKRAIILTADKEGKERGFEYIPLWKWLIGLD